MGKSVKISCYIEEYRNEGGMLCVRLRDKETNKKIVLVGRNVDKNHLIIFLSQAKINQNIMPTIYNRNGSDIVAVRGCIVSSTAEEIEVNIENGGYLFE